MKRLVFECSAGLCVLAMSLGLAIPSMAAVAGSDDEHVLEWIRASAVPLETVEPGNGFDDMQPLREMIGSARVVALGESTHGTREIFQMKHRFFEFLVEEMGFTIFAIEASYPDCLAINRYVINGEGDPEEALHGQGFWTWDTEEVLDLILWMRRYNETAPAEKQLRFYGVDIQNFISAAVPVLEAIETVDADAARHLRESLAPMMDPHLLQAYQQASAEDRDRLRRAVEELIETVERHRTALVETITEDHYEEVIHRSAVVASQTEWMLRSMTEFTADMDMERLQQVAIVAPTAAARLLEHFRRTDEAFAEEAEPLLSALRDNLQALFMQLLGSDEDSLDEEESRWRDLIAGARSRIERESQEQNEDDHDEVEAGVRLRHVEQISELMDFAFAQIRRMKNAVNVRDVSMAANTKWLADRYPDARIALWAHNGHITRFHHPAGGQTIGSELSRIMGDDFVNIGFSFNRGAFQAIYQFMPDEQWDGRTPVLREHRVADAFAGSIDRTFAEAGMPIFVLDLRSAPDDGPVRDWLETPRPMRSIGAIFADHSAMMFYMSVALSEHYDGVIFIDETTRARPNRRTRRMYGIPDPTGD